MVGELYCSRWECSALLGWLSAMADHDAYNPVNPTVLFKRRSALTLPARVRPLSSLQQKILNTCMQGLRRHHHLQSLQFPGLWRPNQTQTQFTAYYVFDGKGRVVIRWLRRRVKTLTTISKRIVFKEFPWLPSVSRSIYPKVIDGWWWVRQQI